MDNLFAKTRHKTLFTMASAAGLLLATVCLSGIGCTSNEAPTVSETFNKAEFYSAEPVESNSYRNQLIADILGAQDSIDIAVSRLENTEVADALVTAHNRGVNVRVVSDWDSWAGGVDPDAGLKVLEDEDVLPVYGDGELLYLPEPTLASILGDCRERPEQQFRMCSRAQDSSQGAMLRPGEFNLMSHNFAVIDEFTVWNFPPLVSSDLPWMGWRIDSSLLAYDFGTEFQQMHGGVFSTTLDVYNGPIKSTTNANVQYFTDKGRLKVWFNPQQRLMKALIDQVYKAQASVWVMSDNLSNPRLLNALEYKANNGFDVRIMVHPEHQATGESLNRLDALDVRMAPDALDHLPTLVVIDQSEDRNARKRPREVISLSHPLWHASPYEVVPSKPVDLVHIYPSDLFVDGNMWQLSESGATVHQDSEIDRYVDGWLKIWQQ